MIHVPRVTHLWVLIVAVGSGALAGQDGPRDNRPRSRDDLDRMNRDDAEHSVRKFLAVVNTVLEHDVDPPARQQLVLQGVKAVFTKAGRPVPARLSQRISDLATDEQITHFLRQTLAELIGETDEDVRELEVAMMGGALSAVPGKPELIATKDFTFQEQVRTTGYVGVGISIALDEETRSPLIIDVRPGPALRAGAKAGDLILEIDGRNTEKAGLSQVIPLLRGEEGSVIALVVRHKGASEKRALTITRGLAPVSSVVGFQRASEATWDYHAAGDAKIAYLRLTGILTKTVHELREAARLLEDQGFRALVLDLRFTLGGAGAHPALLVADALLDGGGIGRLQGPDGRTRTYEASETSLFRGWPIVVLVNRYTRSEAELLAAALQDNRGTILVGEPTAGDGFEYTEVSSGEDIGAVRLRTALLYRADGRPLLRPAADAISVRGSSVPPPVSEREPNHAESGVAGVVPDHRVPADINQLREISKAMRERHLFNPSAAEPADSVVDPQFEKAIELLQAALE